MGPLHRSRHPPILNYELLGSCGWEMPKGGLEPPRACAHCTLNAARLPIPPLRHGRQTYPARVLTVKRWPMSPVTFPSMSRQQPPSQPPEPKQRVSVARNPKASHDFHILDTFEAGLVLTGTEVKALRRKGANIKEGFARVYRGEVWIEGMYISPHDQGNRYNHDPTRSRKLLLHRIEIERLVGKIDREGLTLVPLELYFLGGKAKLQLALAKGKKTHDKRERLKRKIADRETARAIAWKRKR
jgi:SsrA-binding protein